MSVQTYDVTVEREGRWWVFTIPALHTGGQARSLAEVAFEAQGVAAAWLDVAPDTVVVRVQVTAPGEVLTEWAAAEAEEAAARQAQAHAASRKRSVVAGLRKAGYSAADAGSVLGISKQRVYQIEKPKTPAA